MNDPPDARRPIFRQVYDVCPIFLKQTREKRRPFMNKCIEERRRNTKNVTIETILKVFNALKANVKFSVEIEESEFKLA